MSQRWSNVNLNRTFYPSFCKGGAKTSCGWFSLWTALLPATLTRFIKFSGNGRFIFAGILSNEFSADFLSSTTSPPFSLFTSSCFAIGDLIYWKKYAFFQTYAYLGTNQFKIAIASVTTFSLSFDSSAGFMFKELRMFVWIAFSWSTLFGGGAT